MSGANTADRGVARRSGALLVVDDDADIRDTVAEFLTDEGFAVQTAENGADALQRLRADPMLRVVLLDLMMPVLDGYGFLAEQRRDEALFERVKVIVITAGSLDRVRGGDVDVLPKPLNLDHLLRTLERHLTAAG